MQNNLYGHITNEPMELDKGEALPDNTLFNLLIGATSAKTLKNIGVNAYKQALRKNELDILKDKRKDWGIAFRRFSGKPQEAIEKLKEVQRGFVPNATFKHGGIDFVWGNNFVNKKNKNIGFGLKHIIERRNAQGLNGEEFLNELPNLIDTGNKFEKSNHPGRFYIGDKEKEAVIRTDFNGKSRQWLDSFYKYFNK